MVIPKSSKFSRIFHSPSMFIGFSTKQTIHFLGESQVSPVRSNREPAEISSGRWRWRRRGSGRSGRTYEEQRNNGTRHENHGLVRGNDGKLPFIVDFPIK